MMGVEPISRGATSQHFTIKLQPLTKKKHNNRQTPALNFDGGWIRTNESSNYEPDEITTSPLHLYAHQDSNLEPLVSKTTALSIELWAPNNYNRSQPPQKTKCYLPASTSTPIKCIFHKTRSKRDSVDLCIY